VELEPETEQGESLAMPETLEDLQIPPEEVD
jgi:hypothetical protein